MAQQKFIRTCLVCGAKKSLKSQILSRFVWPKGSDSIVFDQHKKQPGRGGYVCNTEACKTKLQSPKMRGKLKYFLKV